MIKKTIYYFQTFVCVGLFLTSSFAYSSNQAGFNKKLSRFFSAAKELHDNDLLDGELLVAQGDKVLLHLRGNVPDVAEDKTAQYMIGSVSKQFFAAALLKALYQTSTAEDKIADVKKLLHSSVAHFLPSSAPIWNNKMPEWAKRVTLHHLLSHTSGIPDYTDSERYTFQFFESTHTPAEILQLVSDEPLEFSPGSDFLYNNTGYLLIAEVIESLTHMAASDYLHRELIAPLQLVSTFVPTHGTWKDLMRHPNCAFLVKPWHYDPQNQGILYPSTHSEDLSMAKGQGEIISTALDLVKWNIGLHKLKTVLPDPLYQLLISPNLENYGYGIDTENVRFGKSYSHDGVIGTYRSLLLYVPTQDLSIVVLSHIDIDFDADVSANDRGYKPTEAIIDRFLK